MADAFTLARGAKPGSTHYDILGLSPTATKDEINQAFARHMSALAPRPVAELARLSVAFQTLRDPEKRRAYDATLEPAPKSGYAVQWSPASPPAAALALVDRLTPASAPEMKPRSVAPATPERESKPAAAEPTPPKRSPSSHPVPEQHVRAEDPVREMLIMDDDGADRWSRSRYDDTAINWRKVAAAAGWPILGVAMIGGVAGWSAGIVEQQPPPPETREVPFPPPERSPEPDLSLVAPPSMEVERPTQLPKPAAVAPIARPSPSAKPDAKPEQLANPGDIDLADGDEATPTPAVEQAVPTDSAAAEAATMPLSNKLIARTISRIGYSCGEVASTAPMDGGAPGVFKVTCTSGDSYRASPVRGRYHFRRLGSR